MLKPVRMVKEYPPFWSVHQGFAGDAPYLENHHDFLVLAFLGAAFARMLSHSVIQGESKVNILIFGMVG